MRRTQSFKGLSLFICLVCFSIKPVAKSFLLSLLRVQEIGRLGEKFKKSRQLQDSETPIGESNERADLASASGDLVSDEPADYLPRDTRTAWLAHVFLSRRGDAVGVQP